MPEKVQSSLGSFRGREVAIVGMGKSNRALCRYLAKEGAVITCFDRKTAEELGDAYEELSRLGVRWSLGPDYLSPLPSCKWIFLTPGIKKNLPEIVAARKNGAVVSGEIALFLERCKGRVCGITGSAGKTTTSTLTGLMLKESLPDVPIYVGGNIGSVLVEEVDSIPPEALVVLELSSFQLELVTKSPAVSVVLNLRPNHLDVHDSLDDYISAKKRIFEFQGEGDWCILNQDDPITRELARECPGNIALFSTDRRPLDPPGAQGIHGNIPKASAWLDDDDLKVRIPGADSTYTVASRGDFLVPGKHNISNALAASLVTLLMGGNPEGIGRAIRSFPGVEHRIEFVRKVNGVTYYNDSIATSPDRTEAFLDAVPGPLALILGGYDKGIPFDSLAEKIVARGNVAVITLGKTAPLIEEAISRAKQAMLTGKSQEPTDVTRAQNLEEAMRLAVSKAGPGWSVALSPACASYDMFRNFEERGRVFKGIVANLLSPDQVHDILALSYPGVKSRLLDSSRGNPVDALVATILSQATNDNLSTKAFRNLKDAFPDWDAVLSANPDMVEEALRPGGLYREKTAAIRAALAQIKKDFGDITLEPLRELTAEEGFRYLTSLKGVGPKTAACVLAFGLGKPAFPVDTHVLRIARRLGLVPLKAPAPKAQEILEAVTPDEVKMPLHLMLIEHGRQVCSASRPKCGTCPLRGRCVV